MTADPRHRTARRMMAALAVAWVVLVPSSAGACVSQTVERTVYIPIRQMVGSPQSWEHVNTYGTVVGGRYPGEPYEVVYEPLRSCVIYSLPGNCGDHGWIYSDGLWWWFAWHEDRELPVEMREVVVWMPVVVRMTTSCPPVTIPAPTTTRPATPSTTSTTVPRTTTTTVRPVPPRPKVRPT